MYARLQPAAAGFQKEVGGDVRDVLEAALARHSTLSEGDWLTAEHAGRAFDLRVQKLRPAAAVSVIGARLQWGHLLRCTLFAALNKHQCAELKLLSDFVLRAAMHFD